MLDGRKVLAIIFMRFFCFLPAVFCCRDGSIPVSFIQKYLMRKLELTNEDEVNIFILDSSLLHFYMTRPCISRFLHSLCRFPNSSPSLILLCSSLKDRAFMILILNDAEICVFD